MLHVTNGSIVVSRLHDLGMPGRIIPWDDVLHEGPVRGDLTEDQLRHDRAEFLGREWDDVASIERSLRDRDEQLRTEAIAGTEVVLWFEHDLYDQLHVLQVLDQLGRLGPDRRARVSAILADDFLAAQSDDRLTQWFEARSTVSDPQWAAAGAAWAAFRAADPTGIERFAHPGAWPSLATALQRHLQQFPSTRTGLSRTEQQTLDALADGPMPLRQAFRAANNDVEEANFMGDLGWWYHIRSLLTGPQPLLAVVGEPPADFNHPEWWREDDAALGLTLTETGARVLAGDADRVVLNGINRWLGGVHLMALPGEGPVIDGLWRWDADRRLLHRS
jgi:uncharacterized protein YheU (UPF0270 family)